MEDSRRHRELKDFLRARREALLPRDFGLSVAGRRRTPGLRREEVAAIAKVGVAWYTWLEQGRNINVSRGVLKRISSALRLTNTDERYLFSLIDEDTAAVSAAPQNAVGPNEQAVLNSMVAVPAVILGPCLELLAHNAMAAVLFEVDAFSGPFADNHAWLLFMSPKRRALYGEDWDEVARRTVGVLRARHGARLCDPQFEGLLQALLSNSTEFAKLWKDSRTATLDTLVLGMSHPRLGKLRVASVRFHLPTAPDCFLSVLPPADQQTLQVFGGESERLRMASVSAEAAETSANSRT